MGDFKPREGQAFKAEEVAAFPRIASSTLSYCGCGCGNVTWLTYGEGGQALGRLELSRLQALQLASDLVSTAGGHSQ